MPPAGEQASAGGEPTFEDSSRSGGEPGFEPAGGGGGLPDMRDEPSFEDVLAGMEGSADQAEGQAGAQGESGQAGGEPGSAGAAGEAGTDGAGPMGGVPGSPTGTGSGSGGPLTPAEQVAILDAQLEKGTGEFDTMILEEQARQRAARRNSTEGQQMPGADAPETSSGTTGPAGNSTYGGAGETAAGRGSYGGGIGGAGGGELPQNTAKYPPPEDIPDGNDDDVVARQLREAAMREPDPAVREKLWEEYRKYKGISK